MRNANPPERALLSDYDRAVAASPPGEARTSLSDRREEVARLHRQYAEVGGRPHLVTRVNGWSRVDKRAQLSVYSLTQHGRPLADLRGAVFKAAGGRCLLCATGRPRTMDHVLPKGRHPALSILPLNLIGACDDCNRRKQSTCLDDPEKQFIHPYFDNLPTRVAFLLCAPLSDDGVLSPTFSIGAPDGMDGELARRLEWQFGRLKLGEYYADEAMLYLAEQSTAWLELIEQDESDLVVALERDLRSVARPFGVNTWKAALLQGMLNDPRFILSAREILAPL